jgi:hypothetical protein
MECPCPGQESVRKPGVKLPEQHLDLGAAILAAGVGLAE